MNPLKPLLIALPLLAAGPLAHAEHGTERSLHAEMAALGQQALAEQRSRLHSELQAQLRTDVQDALRQQMQAMLPHPDTRLALYAGPASR